MKETSIILAEAEQTTELQVFVNEKNSIIQAAISTFLIFLAFFLSNLFPFIRKIKFLSYIFGEKL